MHSGKSHLHLYGYNHLHIRMKIYTHMQTQLTSLIPACQQDAAQRSAQRTALEDAALARNELLEEIEEQELLAADAEARWVLCACSRRCASGSYVHAVALGLEQ